MTEIARKTGGLRAIILATAIGSMAAGIYGGLVRLGLPFEFAPRLAVSHGPIMVGGMFGTLISLERAVAMGRTWLYLAPMLFAIGVTALIAGTPAIVAGVLLVAAAGVLAVGSLVVLRQQPALFTFALFCGTLALLAGNALWAAGTPVPDLAGWWLVFLVATIAAERLELSRFLAPPPAAFAVFLAALGMLSAGAALGLASTVGRPAIGSGLLATTGWLLRYDIATTTIRRSGATRFFASAMLAGYAWLGAAGLILIGGENLSFGYDLGLHAVFIGFVISMVFGHALIILPAITGIRLGYHRALYLPLGLLHASVALRLAGGLLEQQAIRQLSGPVTAASLLLFAAILVWRARPAARAATHPDHP